MRRKEQPVRTYQKPQLQRLELAVPTHNQLEQHFRHAI